nr:EOG090X0IGM [Lepidurus arcticus]
MVAFLETLLEDPETQITGVVCIIDMENFYLSKARYFTPSYAMVSVALFQDSFPIRFKGIHLINECFIFGMLFSMIQPFLSEKMKNRIVCHGKIFDGFLHAVPTCRRTVEKRWCRKYGARNWGWKILTPKYDIKTCLNCGHHHEAGRLCPHCYGKVKAETKVLQEAMVNEFGLRPIDKEVAVLYEGEKEQVSDDFLVSKRVVEMKKPRPAWFTKNLLQKTLTTESDASAVVKPSQLG